MQIFPSTIQTLIMHHEHTCWNAMTSENANQAFYQILYLH